MLAYGDARVTRRGDNRHRHRNDRGQGGGRRRARPRRREDPHSTRAAGSRPGQTRTRRRRGMAPWAVDRHRKAGAPRRARCRRLGDGAVANRRRRRRGSAHVGPAVRRQPRLGGYRDGGHGFHDRRGGAVPAVDGARSARCRGLLACLRGGQLRVGRRSHDRLRHRVHHASAVRRDGVERGGMCLLRHLSRSYAPRRGAGYGRRHRASQRHRAGGGRHRRHVRTAGGRRRPRRRCAGALRDDADRVGDHPGVSRGSGAVDDPAYGAWQMSDRRCEQRGWPVPQLGRWPCRAG